MVNRLMEGLLELKKLLLKKELRRKSEKLQRKNRIEENLQPLSRMQKERLTAKEM